MTSESAVKDAFAHHWAPGMVPDETGLQFDLNSADAFVRGETRFLCALAKCATRRLAKPS